MSTNVYKKDVIIKSGKFYLLKWDNGSVRLFVSSEERDAFLKDWLQGQADELKNLHQSPS